MYCVYVLNHSKMTKIVLCYMVSVGGVNLEGVHNIREAIFDHFSNHFKVQGVSRFDVSRLNFRKLSNAAVCNLTRPFLLEEVKQAVWDCDDYKSPGSDGISFDFIKKKGFIKGGFYAIHGRIS